METIDSVDSPFCARPPCFFAKPRSLTKWSLLRLERDLIGNCDGWYREISATGEIWLVLASTESDLLRRYP